MLVKILLNSIIKSKLVILFNVQKRNMHNSGKINDLKALQDKTGTWFYLNETFLRKNLRIGYVEKIDDKIYTESIREKLVRFNFGGLVESNDSHWRKISNFIFGPKLIDRPIMYLDLDNILIAFPLTTTPVKNVEEAGIGKEKGIGFILKNIGKIIRGGKNADQSIVINPIIYDKNGYVVQEEMDEIKRKAIVPDTEAAINALSNNEEEIIPIIALGTKGREYLEEAMRKYEEEEEEYTLGYSNQGKDNIAWSNNRDRGQLAEDRKALFEKQLKNISINNSNTRFYPYDESANSNSIGEKLVFKTGQTIQDFKKKL